MPSHILSHVEFIQLEQLQEIANSLFTLSNTGADGTDTLKRAIASQVELLRAQTSQLAIHLRSEALVAAISRRLLDAPPDQLEAGIREALEELGMATRVQRAYVFLLSEDSQYLVDAFEWVADGVAGHDFSAFKGVSVDAFPWSMEQWRRGETVIVTDPAGLPEAAAPERGACEMLSILSYINMPLYMEGRVLGWLGFDSVGTAKTWSSGELRLMEIARDVITGAIHRKRREELLFRQRELSQRVTSMGVLAAGIAHEINNPLAFVIGNMNYLEEQLKPDHVPDSKVLTDMRDALGHATEGAERVQWIVEDLRALSHGENAERGAVNLEGVINAALRMASNQLRHRARVIRSYARAPAVQANASQLGQVLLNLIVNAAQAIPEGRAPDNEVEIKSYSAGSDVVIEVRDTGCGIPASDLPRIFDPFYTTRDVGEGMGIGLAICHNIVRGFGGTITVASKVDHGTTVTVRLPRSDSGQPTAEPPRPRILVMDDEQRILDMIARFLDGAEVAFAHNGREALDRLAESLDYDVIVCDVMMPDLSGVDVYKHVAARYPGVEKKIVFISGGALSRDIEQFLRQVPNELITKPFSPQRIRDIVTALCKVA